MNETSKKLTELMAAIHAAYYKGEFAPPEFEDRDCGFGRQGMLWVHAPEEDKNNISIDLYDFFDDKLPELEGMEFDTIVPPDGTQIRQKAWCITYSPDWEEHPVLVLCEDASEDASDDSGDDYELTLEYVPEDVQQRIHDWIKNLWHPVTTVYRLLLRAKDGREQRTLAWFPTEEVRKQYYDKAKKRGLTIIEEN